MTTALSHPSPVRPSTPERPRLALVQPGGLVIEPWSRTVYQGQVAVQLTRREFDLLLFLAEHPRYVFTRTQLLTYVWGDLHTGTRTVDVHIRRLRAKVGDCIVTTVRGIGYRLADSAALNIEIVPKPTERFAKPTFAQGEPYF